MKAVLCVEHGPPEKLVVRDVPTPEPGRGQVRISVKAVGKPNMITTTMSRPKS